MFLTVYQLAAYYLSWFFFGVFGLTLNVFCFVVGWGRSTDGRERFFQRLIHRHFALFVWWLRTTRLVHVRYVGFERLSSHGIVIAANHPGLMDVAFLLARVPEALCIFKPAIRGNPVLGAAARCAGYLASDGGVNLARQASEKVAAGHNLVVFPEGTRTPAGESLRPLKPGFVLIARRAQAPIQLVRIECDSNLLTKDWPWWKLPPLPAHVTVSLGPVLKPEPANEPVATAATIEAWFRAPVPSSGFTACTARNAAFFSAAQPESAL
jgi:1-acyl-sn-glycerol-3-phosphate acyltransferase